jgi:hypothetical protein
MKSTAVNASRVTSAEVKQVVTPTEVETHIKELFTLAKDAGSDQFLVSTAHHVV